MDGTFKITLDCSKGLGACRKGQREFQKAFPDGVEYWEVLDRWWALMHAWRCL